MQQLDVHVLHQTLFLEQDIIRVHLPLPNTPASTQHWVNQFCRLVGVEPLEPLWGADRFQVTLFNGQQRCRLCIEWLCDAIWMEGDGGQRWDPRAMWQWMRDKCESQGAG